MIDFSDPLTVLAVFVPIIGGIIASVYYVNKLIQDKNDRKPSFGQFLRKKDGVGVWFIFVHCPSKPIRRCNATFKGQKLQLRDNKDFEKTIPLGSGCNWDMPKDVSDNDTGFVIIRDGKKIIEKERFSKMITMD